MVKDKNLIDYTIQHQDRSDFFHSSGYATAQSGSGIGAAAAGNTDSFAARQAMEQNRQHVRSYHDSQIGNARWAGCKSRQYDRSEDLNKMQSFRNNSSTSNESSTTGGLGVDGSSNRRIGGGYGRTAGTLGKAQSTLSNAKAPIIPSRRSGI